MSPAQHYAKRAGELFLLPDTATKIKQLIDDPKTGAEDLAEVLSYDPVLSVQLLKVANSAMYRFPNCIDSLDRAVQVIGTQSLYNLVLAHAAAQAFSEFDAERFDLQSFWERSISCALLAKHFGDALKIRGAERLFVAGLLHNIGELVMAQLEPEKLEACVLMYNEQPQWRAQLHIFGFSFADVGAALVLLWGIPHTIALPIENQHFALRAPESRDDQVMQLATILAWENLQQILYSEDSVITAEIYRPLGLEQEDLQEALDYVNLHNFSVMQLFFPEAMNIF